MVTRDKLLQTLLQIAKNLTPRNLKNLPLLNRRGFRFNIQSSLLLVPLFLIPLVWVGISLYESNNRLAEATNTIEVLEQKAKNLQQKKRREELVWNQVKKSNPIYLSEAVESLLLLGPELQRVQTLSKQNPENHALRDRLAFLQSGTNKIRFVQKTARKGPYFQETELKLQNSVQMDEQDLKKFLNVLEGDDPSRPLLIIKNFELKKNKEKADAMVYNVQLELIKREP